MQQLLDSGRSGTHFGSSHFLGSTNRKEGKSLEKMATPPSSPSSDHVKNDDAMPPKDKEEIPKPEKKRLESSKDASKEAEEQEDHSKLHPPTAAAAAETDSSNQQELPEMRRTQPRQIKYITPLFYISPLDTSHAMVIVGYVVVMLLSVGTRLYKLDEPFHVW